MAESANHAGKAAGILIPTEALLEPVYKMGFRFVAIGSDGGMVLQGMKANRAAMSKFHKQES